MSICMDCGGPTTGRNKLCATCKENRRRAQKLRYAAKRRERATEEAQKKEQLQRPVKKLVGNGLDAVLFRFRGLLAFDPAGRKVPEIPVDGGRNG